MSLEVHESPTKNKGFSFEEGFRATERATCPLIALGKFASGKLVWPVSTTWYLAAKSQLLLPAANGGGVNR